MTPTAGAVAPFDLVVSDRLLGIPEDVTQVALLPVAWTTGGGLRSAARPAVEEVTYLDALGTT